MHRAGVALALGDLDQHFNVVAPLVPDADGSYDGHGQAARTGRRPKEAPCLIPLRPDSAS